MNPSCNLSTYVSLLILSSISCAVQANNPEITSMPVTNVTAMRVESESGQYPINYVHAKDYQQSTHISEALAQSPSVLVSKGSGQESLTAIRSPVFVGAGACGAFVMSEDGIPLRAANFCNVNQLFDANYIQANGIEIFRGPASEVFGSNAIHGVVNIVSPDFHQASSTRLAFVDSSHGFNRYSADYRGKSFIAQAMFDDDKGYKDNSAYTQAKVRLKQRSQLNEKWHATQSFNAMNLDQNTAGYAVGDDAYKDESRKKESLSPGFRKADAYRYSASFEFSPRENALLLLTPYVRSNDMEFSMHWIDPAITEKNGHNSIGLQSLFARSYNKWQVDTGFDVDYTDAYLKQSGQSIGGVGSVIPAGDHYDYDVNAISTGVFANAAYALSENWLYSIGTRLDYLHLDYSNNLSDGSACDPSVAIENCRFYRPSNTTDSFHDWSPRTSLRWEFYAEQFASINASRTHRSPQATELYRLEQGQQQSDIDSVQADNVEFVLNGAAAGIAYSFSAYHMKKRNVIIKTSEKLNVDGQKTRHQGLELSLRGWLIRERIEFIGSYAYGKHQYDSNPHLIFASGVNIKGNIMDTAPRHLGSLKINWTVVESSILGFETIYLGNYYLNPENNKSYDGHTLSHVYFTQQLPWQIEISGVVKNVFDIDYADRADVQPFSANTSRYFIGEPRSYQLSIAKTF